MRLAYAITILVWPVHLVDNKNVHVEQDIDDQMIETTRYSIDKCIGY